MSNQQNNQNQNSPNLTNNPLFQQAQRMAYGKTDEQMKQLCMQIAKQKGLNFDEILNMFQAQFGNK